MFGKKPKKKKEKIKPEVIERDKQPVIVEMIPKGTKSNPVKCKINSTVYFKVFGYSDYKKENLVELNGSNITWKKSCPVGKWEKDFGIDNVYTAPSTKGYRDIWAKYRDSKLVTSCMCKILMEE
jgi:hypothetical protein